MLKNNTIIGIIEKGAHWLFMALVVLAPLLVIPYTRNLIVDTKTFLVFVVTTLILLGFSVKTLLAQKWEIALSPLTAPLFVFGLAVALSTFLGNKYPVEALLGAGGLYLAFVLVGIFGTSLVRGDHTTKVVRTMSISGALLSISMLLQQFGWGISRLINQISAFNLPDTLLFNVSGSSFVALQVLLISLAGIIALWFSKRKLVVVDWVLGAIITVGLGLSVWSVLPGQPAAVSLTPLSASWTVMARSLETPQSAIIGHGPASYASLYARYKPLWTNGQVYWQFNFGTATSTPFTLITTLGIIGLAAWLFLIWHVFQQLRRSPKESKPLLWMLVTTFIIQLLLPTNTVVLALQIPLFIFWVAANQNHFSLLQFKSVKVRTYPAKLEFIRKIAGKGNWFARVSAALMIALTVGLGYFVTRAYASYFYMYQANRALSTQDVVSVYDNQRRAIQANPYLDSIRREYATTNLQIAVALANKADITDAEREQVVQLIGQAIREGRAAALLDDKDVDNWLALAQIYRNLIGAADEANTWAVSTLVNAANVNPANPLIRLQIGQLMLLDNKPQDAARFFSQAVQLKPDLPAAYYQLGIAFQALNQPADAKAAWEQALALLPTDSQDYLTLQAQINGINTESAAEGTDADTGADAAGASQAETTPNITEQNVQQQENEIITPGEDAQLTP